MGSLLWWAQFLDKAVLVCDGVPKEVLSLEARCPGLVARAEPAVVLAGQIVAVEMLSCPPPEQRQEGDGAEPCQMLCRAGGHYLGWQVRAPCCDDARVWPRQEARGRVAGQVLSEAHQARSGLRNVSEVKQDVPVWGLVTMWLTWPPVPAEVRSAPSCDCTVLCQGWTEAGHFPIYMLLGSYVVKIIHI